MFKPCGGKVFSLRIHFSSWDLRAAAVLILLCNMVTLKLWLKLWLWWKSFANSLLLYDVVAMFRETLWRFFSCMSYIQYIVRKILSSVNNFFPCSFHGYTKCYRSDRNSNESEVLWYIKSRYPVSAYCNWKGICQKFYVELNLRNKKYLWNCS